MLHGDDGLVVDSVPVSWLVRILVAFSPMTFHMRLSKMLYLRASEFR